MVRARRWALCLLLLGAAAPLACRKAPTRSVKAPEPVVLSGIPPSTLAAAGEDEGAAPRPLTRCFADQPVWVEAPVAALLDRAGELFDGDRFEEALACAEEAARQAPRSVEAHHDRAAALVHLGRLDEARDAIELALALDPDDPETLEASADLHINQLSPSADRSAVGLEHARRGFRRAAGRDRARSARLAVLEAQALIDLGRAGEGLRRLDAALVLSPRLVAARYEKGVALFELCRFADSRRELQRVLAASPDHVHALFHLGLVEERLGEIASAEIHLGEAAARDPASFPAPPLVSPAEFAERVRRIVAALPDDVRADLERAQVETAELPALEDLIAESPPLSPTILGLYRGLPLDWQGDADERPQAGRVAKGRRPPGPAAAASVVGGDGLLSASSASYGAERTIVLYRRNLLRAVRNLDELDPAIRRTLLHEIGHLRGEDDGSLRDRGLE
jgi:tetratricopeptide (TPR) repeat protein